MNMRRFAPWIGVTGIVSFVGAILSHVGNLMILMGEVLPLWAIASLVGFIYLLRLRGKSLCESIGNVFNIIFVLLYIVSVFLVLRYFPHQT
jgi:hypothetical protein